MLPYQTSRIATRLVLPCITHCAKGALMSLSALSARFSSSSTVDPSAISFDQTWVSFVFAHTIAWICGGRALSGERDGKHHMQKAESKCFRAYAKLVLVDG